MSTNELVPPPGLSRRHRTAFYRAKILERDFMERIEEEVEETPRDTGLYKAMTRMFSRYQTRIDWDNDKSGNTRRFYERGHRKQILRRIDMSNVKDSFAAELGVWLESIVDVAAFWASAEWIYLEQKEKWGDAFVGYPAWEELLAHYRISGPRWEWRLGKQHQIIVNSIRSRGNELVASLGSEWLQRLSLVVAGVRSCWFCLDDLPMVETNIRERISEKWRDLAMKTMQLVYEADSVLSTLAVTKGDSPSHGEGCSPIFEKDQMTFDGRFAESQDSESEKDDGAIIPKKYELALLQLFRNPLASDADLARAAQCSPGLISQNKKIQDYRRFIEAEGHDRRRGPKKSGRVVRQQLND